MLFTASHLDKGPYVLKEDCKAFNSAESLHYKGTDEEDS